MKDKTALKWIWNNSRQELPGLVLLTVSNALYSVCGVSMAVFAKLIIDAAQKGEKTTLIKNAVWLLLVIIAQIILKLTGKSLEIRISGKLEIKYKTALFSNIMKKDY